jgi:DNA ligase-1
MNQTHSTPLRRLLAALLFGATLSFLACAWAETDIAAPPAVLLAQDFNDAMDPHDYWVSEKLDGVRALWDGKTLRFRSGRLIHAPAWFTRALPAHHLDGELWMGHGRFEQVSAAVRREEALDAEWKTISYQIFEWPGAPGSFTERIAALKTSIEQAKLPWLKLVAQYRVADSKILKARLHEVVREGGEGLMLHRADAPWQTGRTDALLKLKLHQDAEAKVVAHLPGKGKYEGMCGALLVEMADGRRFRLGSGLSDAERRSPPAVGSMVTYRYRGHTASGLPRFASFLRIRHPE